MENETIIKSLQVATLYQHDAIIAAPESLAVQEKMDAIKTVIFLSKEEYDNPVLLDFLGKILNACKINASETSYQTEPMTWRTIKDTFPNVAQVFLFGKSVHDTLGLWLQHGTYHTFLFDKKRIVCAEPISRLSVDNNAKTFFWKEILQPVFAQ